MKSIIIKASPYLLRQPPSLFFLNSFDFNSGVGTRVVPNGRFARAGLAMARRRERMDRESRAEA